MVTKWHLSWIKRWHGFATWFFYQCLHLTKLFYMLTLFWYNISIILIPKKNMLTLPQLNWCVHLLHALLWHNYCKIYDTALHFNCGTWHTTSVYVSSTRTQLMVMTAGSVCDAVKILGPTVMEAVVASSSDTSRARAGHLWIMVADHPPTHLAPPTTHHHHTLSKTL